MRGAQLKYTNFYYYESFNCIIFYFQFINFYDISELRFDYKVLIYFSNICHGILPRSEDVESNYELKTVDLNGPRLLIE